MDIIRPNFLSVHGAGMLLLLCLPLTSCIHLFSPQEFPEHELELIATYNGLCLGTITPAGGSSIEFTGTLRYGWSMDEVVEYGPFSRSVLISCSLDSDTSTIPNGFTFVNFIDLKILFQDYIDTFETDLLSDDRAVNAPASVGLVKPKTLRYFQLANDKLNLNISSSTLVGAVNNFDALNYLPSQYSIPVVGTEARTEIFENQTIPKASCGYQLYSKHGVLSISPSSEYTENGTYATINAAMTLGSGSCMR